jgi:hypothetical protein
VGVGRKQKGEIRAAKSAEWGSVWRCSRAGVGKKIGAIKRSVGVEIGGLISWKLRAREGGEE